MTRKDANGRLTIDESLEDWILFYEGDVAKIGRLVGTTEDAIREEMEDETPRVTLSPVFVFTRTPVGTDQGMGVYHSMHRLEKAFNLGDDDRAPHVLLTDFEFASDMDDSSRRLVVRRMNEAQHRYIGQIVVASPEVR